MVTPEQMYAIRLNDEEKAGVKSLAFFLIYTKTRSISSSNRERLEMTQLQFMTLVLVMIGFVAWLYVPYIFLYSSVVLGFGNI